jgi:hypothetical protein
MDFTITNASVTTSSKIMVVQSGAAATGRQSDENEMDPLIFSAVAGTGQFTLYANSTSGPVYGLYNIYYMLG